MMALCGFLTLAVATSVLAQQPVPTARIVDDAKVLDRVAEISKRDLPRDLLRRIVDEDIEILRGKRSDGNYQYAGYERMETSRVSDSFSVDPEKNERVLEISGPFTYRLLISVPSRRLLVTHNRRLYVDRVEIEYIPQNSSTKKSQTAKVEAWLEPGASQTIEFDEIARQATVRVYAHAETGGYSNVVLTLTQARVFDDPTSPYADAVASEKAIRRAIDHDEISSIRAMAQRIVNSLQPATLTALASKAPAASLEVVAPKVEASPLRVDAPPAKADPDMYGELQSIEDLLTGNDTERRQGLERLHQIVRRLRPPSR